MFILFIVVISSLKMTIDSTFHAHFEVYSIDIRLGIDACRFNDGFQLDGMKHPNLGCKIWIHGRAGLTANP